MSDVKNGSPKVWVKIRNRVARSSDSTSQKHDLRRTHFVEVTARFKLAIVRTECSKCPSEAVNPWLTSGAKTDTVSRMAGEIDYVLDHLSGWSNNIAILSVVGMWQEASCSNLRKFSYVWDENRIQQLEVRNERDMNQTLPSVVSLDWHMSRITSSRISSLTILCLYLCTVGLGNRGFPRLGAVPVEHGNPLARFV